MLQAGKKFKSMNYLKATIKKIRLLAKIEKEFFKAAKNKEWKRALNIYSRYERVCKI